MSSRLPAALIIVWYLVLTAELDQRRYQLCSALQLTGSAGSSTIGGGGPSGTASNATGNGAIHGSLREYCNMETFNATCPRTNDVIIIRRARYGRMQMSRCVKQSLGYEGCSADVMSVLDVKCSGKRRCEFTLPDADLYVTHPCPTDTTSYLEVAYDCIPAVPADGQRCNGDANPVQLRGQVGYIHSGWNRELPFESGNVGYSNQLSSCRWLIQAQPGQRFNLTLFHFGRTATVTQLSPVGASSHHLQQQQQQHQPGYRPPTGGDTSTADCYELAVVSERSTASFKRLMVCGIGGTASGTGEGTISSSGVGGSRVVSPHGYNRQRHLYESTSNVVDLLVNNYATASPKLGRFLIKYEAISCPDLARPLNGQATRQGDVTTVTCDNGGEAWYLTCNGVKWNGNYGNCSSYAAESSANAVQRNNLETFPYGILIVVAVGVALGVLLGGLLLIFAVLYMRRKRRPCDQLQHGSGLTSTLMTSSPPPPPPHCMLVGSPRQYHPVRSAMIHRAGGAGSGSTLSAQLHHVDKYHHHVLPPPSGLTTGTLAGYCGVTGPGDGMWFEPPTMRSTDLCPAVAAEVASQLYWDQTIKFIPVTASDDGTTVNVPDLMATPEMSERSWTRIQNSGGGGGDGVAVSL